MPIPSGGMNDLPAWLASRPRTRSASVGWPHDSCEPKPRTVRPDAGPFRVREKFHDAVVAELEVPRGDLETERHEVAVDRLDLRDLLLHGDVGELSLLRDRPVHLDRVFVREGDLRLAPRGLGDLDGVVHDGAHIGLLPQVPGREPEGPIDEDPHAHAAILADV